MLVIFFRWAWGIPYGVNRLIARYCMYLKKYWSWNSAMHHFGNLETCTTTYQLGGHRMLVIFFRWAWGIPYGVNRLIARYCIYLMKYWSWNSAMHHFGNLETCTTTYQLGGHRMLVIFFRWAWGIPYGVNCSIAR